METSIKEKVEKNIKTVDKECNLFFFFHFTHFDKDWCSSRSVVTTEGHLLYVFSSIVCQSRQKDGPGSSFCSSSGRQIGQNRDDNLSAGAVIPGSKLRERDP